jgi:hypothetical protein
VAAKRQIADHLAAGTAGTWLAWRW